MKCTNILKNLLIEEFKIKRDIDHDIKMLKTINHKNDSDDIDDQNEHMFDIYDGPNFKIENNYLYVDDKKLLNQVLDTIIMVMFCNKQSKSEINLD